MFLGCRRFYALRGEMRKSAVTEIDIPRQTAETSELA
jgi:hypothetical protein